VLYHQGELTSDNDLVNPSGARARQDGVEIVLRRMAARQHLPNARRRLEASRRRQKANLVALLATVTASEHGVRQVGANVDHARQRPLRRRHPRRHFRTAQHVQVWTLSTHIFAKYELLGSWVKVEVFMLQ
jgi:hypothetical protein